MRPYLLLCCAILVSGCVTRVSAPTVRPTWLQSPEGEWQEVLMEMKMAMVVPRYRADGILVEEVERERPREHNDGQDLLRRRMVRTDTVDVTYEMHGPDGWRATVSAVFSQASDIETPIRLFGRRNPDDDNRIYHFVAFRSIQRMQLSADSSKWWTMERVSIQGTSPTPGVVPIQRLMRGPRELLVYEVTPSGRRSSAAPRALLNPEAEGFLVQDGDLPLAVVQRAGGSLLGANDMRIWLPSGISAEERRERIAMLFLLLIGDSRWAFSRTH